MLRHRQVISPIRNYTYTQYKAHQSNNAIVQDKRGVMYFGNTFGVLEYDGAEWRLIETEYGSPVRSLTIDTNGTIYAGAVSEFGCLVPDSTGKLQYYALLDYVNDNDRNFSDVWETHAAPEGVYFRTPEKLFRWDGFSSSDRKKETVKGRRGESVTGKSRIKVWDTQTAFHVMFYVYGDIYVRQWEIGLMKMVNDSLVLVQGGEQFAYTRIYGMYPYSKNHVLIVTRGEGFYLMNYYPPYLKKQTSFFPFPSNVDHLLKNSTVFFGTALSGREDNHFAIGTQDIGTIILNNDCNFIRSLNESSGLTCNLIGFQYQDIQNNLWLALEDGISKIQINSPVTYFGKNTGLEGSVQSIIRYNDILFAGTAEGLFFQFHPDKIKRNNDQITSDFDVSNTFRPVRGISADCYDLLIDSSQERGNKQSLIAATAGGIYQIQSPTKNAVLITPGTYYFLYKSVKNPELLIAGAWNGVDILENKQGKWSYKGSISNIEGEIRSIAEDTNGQLWFGDNFDGVHKMTITGTDTSIKKFNNKHGLSEGSILVKSLYDYSNLQKIKRLLFAGETGAFRYFPDKKIPFVHDSTYGLRFGDGSWGIHRLTQNKEGDVWMSAYSSKGNIFQIGFSDLTKDYQYEWENTPFMNFPEEIYNSIYHDKNNITWLGYRKGLIRYDPEIKYKYTLDELALIRKVIIASDSVIFWGTNWVKLVDEIHLNETSFVSSIRVPAVTQPEYLKPVLPFRYNSIKFEYAVPNFNSEQNSEYQYYLENFDKKWSKWSGITHASYTNLPSGKYQFKVKARNVYKSESKETVYEFTINPPFYNTIWFYSSQISFILLLFALAFYFGRGGRSARIATVLATVSIVILFEYLQTYVEESLENILGGIIVIKVLLNVLLVFTLLPIEKFMKDFIIIERKRRKIRKQGRSIKKIKKVIKNKKQNNSKFL